jgi:hypothetical protein
MTEPRVYLIAKPQQVRSAVADWLFQVGGEECLQNLSGSDAKQLSELAGRRCYKSFAPLLKKI